jgi:hypothetical protein
MTATPAPCAATAKRRAEFLSRLDALCPVSGLQARLMDAFALSASEVVRLQPHEDDFGQVRRTRSPSEPIPHRSRKGSPLRPIPPESPPASRGSACAPVGLQSRRHRFGAIAAPSKPQCGQHRRGEGRHRGTASPAALRTCKCEYLTDVNLLWLLSAPRA